MNASTKTRKTARALLTVMAAIIACVFCVSLAVPQTTARAAARSSYALPSAGLPTGVPDVIDGKAGYLYTFTLPAGFYNTYGYGLYSGTLADSGGKNPTIDIQSDYFRIGTGSGDFAAGVTATIYGYMTLPKELRGIRNASVKARFSYDYEVSSEKTKNAGMRVTMGSYAIAPDDSVAAPAKGANAKRIMGTGDGTTNSGSETTDWTNVNTSFDYLVINMEVSGFENIEEGTIIKKKKCQTSFKAKNFVVELFVVNDGNAPTITPWYPTYSLNSSGAYVRAADGVNFVPYVEGMVGTRYDVDYSSMQPVVEEYFNSSNGFSGNAYVYSAHYQGNVGRVLCHDYTASSKDDGKTNMFLSQQQKQTKTVSFIVYDYFSGVKSLSVTVGGNTYTIYVDEENSFSWGDVEATSFAYLDASKSGELYRGISVKMTVSEAGNYQVSVSDYGDLESFVYVNVGGMDVDAPEIPNMVIENAVYNAKTGNTYAQNVGDRIRVLWQLTEDEEAGQTEVTYSYKIERKEGETWTEILALTEIDSSKYISVKGGINRYFDMTGITNGTYRVTVSCVDGAGNVGVYNDGFSDYTERTFEFTADNVVPNLDITLTTGSSAYLGEWVKGKTVRAKYSFSSSNISGLTYYYRIGASGDEASLSADSKTFTDDMDDTVYFWAVSGAGLRSNVISHVIRIDSTAPEFPPIAGGLLSYASLTEFSDGSAPIVRSDAKVYAYPWGVVPYMSIEGDDASSAYVFEYKYYYKVFAEIGGTWNGGGAVHSVNYNDGTTFVMDLFDDGVTGARAYGKKRVQMWVTDQAGNSSGYVYYTIEVRQPEIVVSFEKTDVNADKFYDGTSSVAEGYVKATVRPEGMSLDEYMQISEAGFAADETFAINFRYFFDDVNAAENVQIVISGVTVQSGCNKYIDFYKLVDEDGNEILSSTEFRPADFAANIGAARLTVEGFKFRDREYDGTANAIVESKGTVVSLDSTLDPSVVAKLTYTYDAESAVYADKNVGLKHVLLTGLVLGVVDPADSAMLSNFTFVDSLEVVGQITAKKLTLADFYLAGTTKIYDGTNNVNASDVVLNLKAGVVDGEEVEIDYTALLRNANVIYNDEGAIIPNTLTVSVKGLKGADAANYSLAAETKTFDYTVEPKTVSVKSIAIGSKTYDGTNRLVDEKGNRLSVTTEIDGLVTNLDKINITLTYDISMSKFASSDVGTWDIEIFGIKLATRASATSTGNYVLKEGDDTYNTTAIILPRELGVRAAASARAYNGTSMAENPTITYTNVVAGENIFVGKPASAFTNLVSARTASGAIVDLYRVGYSSPVAAVSSYVSFVFGGYKHVSECTDAADMVAKRYNVTFAEDANGDYLFDDATGHYRLITAGETPAVRYSVENVQRTDTLATDSYVVWHMIYNADGTENKNYCFSQDGGRVIGVSAPAAIERAEAVAEMTGFYTYDENGLPYMKDDGVEKDYIKKLYYGGKTAVLESGKEVKVNRFGYDVIYYCDNMVIDGVLQPRVVIDTETHPSLNPATVVEPRYDTASVGKAQIGMKNAVVNNFDFISYKGVEFDVLPAPLTVSIANAGAKYKDRIRLGDISIKIHGLQNNQKISSLLGKTPMASLVVDGVIREGENGILDAEIAPGKYAIVVKLVAEEGFSIENYTVKTSDGYTVETVSGGFIVTKADGFTVTKNVYRNYEFTEKSSYTYKGSTEFLPLRLTSLPDGVTTDDLKIYVYTGDGVNWKLADAYGYKYSYDFASGVWTEKSTYGTDGKGVKNAGTYKIVYELTGMANYEDITLTGYLTINKKQVEIKLPISTYEKVYDGQSVNLWNLKTIDASDLVIRVNGVLMGESNTQYSKDAKFKELISQSQVKNAGVYYCRLYYAGDENVNYAYSETLIITIRKKSVSITVGETKFNYYDYFTEDGEPVGIYDEDEEYLGDAKFEGVTFEFAEGTDEKVIAPLKNKIKVYYLEQIIKGSKPTNEWRLIDWSTDANQERVKNSQQAGEQSSWNYRIVCEDDNYQIFSAGGLTGYMEIGVKTVFSTDEDGNAQDNYYYFVKMENNKGVSKSSKLTFSAVERLTPSDVVDPDDYDLENPEDLAAYEKAVEYYENSFNVWYNLLNRPLNNNKESLGINKKGSVTAMTVFTVSFFNNGTEVRKLEEVSPVSVSFAAFDWNVKDPTLTVVDYDYTADGKIGSSKNVSEKFSKLKLVRISGGLVTELPYELAYDDVSETYVMTFSTDILGDDCFYALVAGSSSTMTEGTRYIVVAVACAVGGFAIILAVVLIVSAKAKAKAVSALGRPIDAKGQKKAEKAKKKEEKKAAKEDDSSDADEKEEQTEGEKAEEKTEVKPSEKPQTEPTAQASDKTQAPTAVKPQTAPEVKPQAAPAAKPQAAPAVKPQAAPAAKPQAAPAAKPQAAPAVKPQAAPAAKPQAAPAAKPQAAPAAKPQAAPAAKPQAAPAAKPQAAPAAKPQAAPTAKPAAPQKPQPPKPEEKK